MFPACRYSCETLKRRIATILLILVAAFQVLAAKNGDVILDEVKDKYLGETFVKCGQWRTGEIDTAKTALVERVYRENGEWGKAVMAECALGMAMNYAGNTEQALVWFQQADRHLDECQSARWMVRFYLAQLTMQSNPKVATRYASQAMDEYAELVNSERVAQEEKQTWIWRSIAYGVMALLMVVGVAIVAVWYVRRRKRIAEQQEKERGEKMLTAFMQQYSKDYDMMLLAEDAELHIGEMIEEHEGLTKSDLTLVWQLCMGLSRDEIVKNMSWTTNYYYQKVGRLSRMFGYESTKEMANGIVRQAGRWFKIVVVACLLMTSCGKVVHVKESDSKFNEAETQYPELTYVTVEELGRLIHSDHHKYKVVVVNDAFIEGTNWSEHIASEIVPRWQKMDTTRVSLYLVAYDCAYLEEMDSFFIRHKIDCPRYVIRDEKDRQVEKARKSNYYMSEMTPRLRRWAVNADMVTDYIAMQNSMVIDARGRVKLALFHSDKGVSCKAQILPVPFEMLHESLDDVDFGKVETMELCEEDEMYKLYFL